MKFDFKMLCFSGLLCASSFVCAEEPKPPTPPKTEDTAKPKDGDKAQGDLYKIPEKYDSTSLVSFCKRIFEFRPKTEAEGELHGKNAPTALKDACQKILALEKGDATEAGHFARRVDLMLRTEGLDPTKPEFETFVGDFKKFIATGEVEGEDIQLAMELPGVYEQLKKPEKARELCEFFSKIFAKSKDARIQQAGKSLEGTARRMGLVGNELVLKGTTMDGKPFDITSMKGKVVLVDFWATWCGFCIQELPNVRKNYAGYHRKGFEVVGISADEDREKLESFLAENKLPWVTLHEKGGQNPALEYYGIPGFPTTFLVGKDGKVLALEARGPELGKLLKEQLGEPDPVKEDEEGAKEDKKPSNVDSLDKRMKDIVDQKKKDEEPKK